MPRAARIVVPGMPHHVTQRGNRQQDIFVTEDDWGAYKGLLAAACKKYDVSCVAWCLMPNYVHLILTPPAPDSLRAVLASVHTAYSQRINLRENAVGHLFQGRFASYPMTEPHLMAAIRYVENNPVKARLVDRAIDWPWSSARCHVTGRADGLTSTTHVLDHYSDWASMLAQGWEAGEGDTVEALLLSGRARGRPKKGTVPEVKRGQSPFSAKPPVAPNG